MRISPYDSETFSQSDSKAANKKADLFNVYISFIQTVSLIIIFAKYT